MGAKWQKIDLRIPDELTSRQRKKLGDLVIDHIIRRTESGVDKRGREFPGYSKGYIDSLDFRNAGKSAADINLTLSGDMLASLKLLQQSEGFLSIGFENGSEENARADGNIRGTYGKSKGSKAKARDFLGIDKATLRDLIDEVMDD